MQHDVDAVRALIHDIGLRRLLGALLSMMDRDDRTESIVARHLSAALRAYEDRYNDQ